MFEPHHAPLLPREEFLARLWRHAFLGLAMLGVCLGAGMAGYHFLEHQRWIDAFANAAMILSGMGPLDPLRTTAGKLFAGTYAIFSGVAFLTTVGLFLAPIVHRFLHQFHLQDRADR